LTRRRLDLGARGEELRRRLVCGAGVLRARPELGAAGTGSRLVVSGAPRWCLRGGKNRTGDGFGLPAEAVDWPQSKQACGRLTAQWLAARPAGAVGRTFASTWPV